MLITAHCVLGMFTTVTLVPGPEYQVSLLCSLQSWEELMLSSHLAGEEMAPVSLADSLLSAIVGTRFQLFCGPQLDEP